MLKIVLFAALLVSFKFAHAQDDVITIKNLRSASNAAIAKHDIEGISKDWLPDFVITRGSGVTAIGKDSVIATWKKLFSTNATVSYERIPSSVVVGDNGLMAWETGTWTAKKSYSAGGNYSAMWRKIDGAWKLQAELFVSLKQN